MGNILLSRSCSSRTLTLLSCDLIGTQSDSPALFAVSAVNNRYRALWSCRSFYLAHRGNTIVFRQQKGNVGFHKMGSKWTETTGRTFDQCANEDLLCSTTKATNLLFFLAVMFILFDWALGISSAFVEPVPRHRSGIINRPKISTNRRKILFVASWMLVLSSCKSCCMSVISCCVVDGKFIHTVVRR